MREIDKCLEEIIKRRQGIRYPDGHFDSGGRWYPSEQEKRKCCLRVRKPSRNFPHSILRHCFSIEHVCNLFGLKETEKVEIRRYLRQAKT